MYYVPESSESNLEQINYLTQQYIPIEYKIYDINTEVNMVKLKSELDKHGGTDRVTTLMTESYPIRHLRSGGTLIIPHWIHRPKIYEPKVN